MFKLPTRPDDKARPLEHRRYFWTWFFINAIFNLVDIEDMPPDMETNAKYSILIFGRTLFFNDKSGNLRSLYFTDAGEVPIYPGQIVRMRVVNPVIGEYTYTADKIGVDCVPVYLTMLDRCQIAAGFSDLVRTFAQDLAENDVSISMAQFLKRLPVVFKAKTDPDLEAIKAVLMAVWDGRPEIVAQSPLANMLERMDGTQGAVTPLTEFTEYQQYKLGQFYAILGVNTVWNIKREKVAAAENATNGETARYNIADIIDNLNDQLTDVNRVFGTNFRARLNVERAQEIAETVEDDNPDTAEDAETEGGANDDTQN